MTIPASVPGNVTFSVVIPALNEERNIGRCLESIAATLWPVGEVEVVLVDNGSADRTAEIARAMGARVVIRPGDTVAALRNVGAGQSSGAILAFLDADCTVPPDWLCQAARYLQREDVVCFGSPPVVPEESTWVQRSWFFVRRKKGCVETEWLESMNMFVRREAFWKLGGFNADLVTCEDYDLSLRLGLLGRVVSDERIVAVHHGEAASVGHFFRKEYWRALGNLRGLGSHAFRWRELPSVVFPLVYCALASITVACLVAASFQAETVPSTFALILLVLWQFPLGLLAWWKIGGQEGIVAVSQLYLLFNVYFFARGLASVRLR